MEPIAATFDNSTSFVRIRTHSLSKFSPNPAETFRTTNPHEFSRIHFCPTRDKADRGYLSPKLRTSQKQKHGQETCAGYNSHMKTTISYTEARDRLASVWDETVSTREPVIISRRGSESVVLVAL